MDTSYDYDAQAFDILSAYNYKNDQKVLKTVMNIARKSGYLKSGFKDLKLFIYICWDRSFRLLLGPPGLNWLSSFASDFQWCCLTDQGSPSVMQHIVSVESSSLLLHSYLT